MNKLYTIIYYRSYSNWSVLSACWPHPHGMPTREQSVDHRITGIYIINILGTGWFVTVPQTPAEVCLTDLAWDYPGV